MHEPEDKKGDMGSKLEGLWDKVSKGVEEGLKVGKEEIVRTAKIGKIRLDIASLKSKKNEKVKLLGARTYGLLQSKEIKVSQLDELLEEIKGVDAQIDNNEEEIQAIMAKKSVTEEGETEEAAPAEEATPATEPAKTKRTSKKKTVPASTDKPPKDAEGEQESAEDKTEGCLEK